MSDRMKMVITALVVMTFCAVGAWAFKDGAYGLTSVQAWTFICAYILASLGVAYLWMGEKK